MIALILRLFALRPLFTLAVFGTPVLVLIAVGLLTIVALKALVFLAIPIALAIWLFRRLTRETPTIS